MLKDWQGTFGDEYTERNPDNPLRIPLFHQVIPKDVYTALEVGCNQGQNLACLEDLGIDTKGVEPNLLALSKAHSLNRTAYYGTADNIRSKDRSVDLIFTCGVLMHIPDSELDKAMQEIWRVTKRYVLAIEYQGNDEEVEYRGQKGMLWKRRIYKYPGALIKEGDLGKEFDGCHYWLYEKGDA